jgi:hypothetical protein
MKYQNLALEIVAMIGKERDPGYIKVVCNDYADAGHIDHESIDADELFDAVKKELAV